MRRGECFYHNILIAITVILPTMGWSTEDLESVTVTARKRPESVQTVPIALSLLGGRRLDDTATVNLQQTALLVPSLYYNSANPRNTAYTIRGLGSNTLSISAANDGIEPGVGFYVDEVYHGRPASASFDFTDIERIEILRGPQGTLYGKNTTAGAIHVLSREPSFTREVLGQVSFGSFDFFQTKLALGDALSETVAGRVSAQLTRRNGLIRQALSGKSLNAVNNRAARIQLLIVPSESFKLRLIADVSDQDSSCCTQSFLRVGQSLRSPSRQFQSLATGIGYEPPSRNVYDRLSDIDGPLYVDTQDGGVTAIADWQLSDGRLTSITAWRYWDWDVANDRDFTGIPIQIVQRIPSRQDQYSQELRYASGESGAWRHVSGLYFFQQRISGRPTSVYGTAAAYWLLNPDNFTVPIPSNLLDGYGQTGNSDFTMSSYAAFGEVSISLASDLVATMGLRYTHEDKGGVYSTEVFGGADLSGLSPASRIELDRAKLSVFRPQSYEAKIARGNVSGRVSLAYQLTDSQFAYVNFSRGFKSGGLNMSGLPLDAQNRPKLSTAVIKDELNKTIEGGLKSNWRGNRMTLNTAIYQTRVTNYQANIVSSLETAALRSYPANIPEVQVRGAEADLEVRPLTSLTLRTSIAYADGINTSYPSGPCPLEVQTATTVACDLTGARLAGLSKWSATVGAEYRIRAVRSEWAISIDTVMRSRYNSETSGSKYTWIDGYSVTNVRAALIVDGRWQIDLFVRNVLDKDYLTALTIQSGNSGLILGQPSDPRMFGINAKLTIKERLSSLR